MDITSTNLGLAILDQRAGGMFGSRPYAYLAIIDGDRWALGIAVANERGYNPTGLNYADRAEAETVAAGMNKHLNLSDDDTTGIIVSTMGGRRYAQGAAGTRR